MAEAIRLSTMARPSTISITMMKEVRGAWVAAARKPAMPMAIRLGLSSGLLQTASSWPTPAPIDSEGAKIPPATPVQAVNQVATNFSGTKSSDTSDSPLSMARTASEPLPKL